jgi:hypothetical protein
MPGRQVQPFHFFNHSARKHLLGRPIEVSSTYKHSLGGAPSEYDMHFIGPAVPMHLIYRLDLADPLIDISLPNVRWLPLCYGFGFGGARTTYLARSDSHVVTIEPANVGFDPDFPYEKYPLRFSQHAVSFAQAAYDPTDVDDALRLAGVFGLDRLSPAGRKTAIARLEEFGFFEEIDAYEMTKDEFLDTCGFPFEQGTPETDCQNPDCAYFRKADSLVVIGMIEGDPADDISLWGEPGIQLIFQKCNHCNCICVTNQCT